jgi:adenylate cyclase
VVANRRLAAIMFTDMVGFTAAAQTDETSSLRLLREQEQLVRPLFAAHHGREIKSTGDGFLVEFDSALHAVRCAIDILEHVHERNSQPRAAPIRLRIGVHLGDVEERGSDIFGDAVNVASRIQRLAAPGGLCISSEVFNQVQNKLPNRFERLGPTTLKDVRVPVELYRVSLPWDGAGPPPGSTGRSRLAVLPLANISPDPKDEYFADGLTEELISALSKLRELTVIARTSVSQYKSGTKPVSQIAAELGVDSVLEGSVRKAGDRLRITLQLIDAGTQGHLWTNSFDRDLDDVFAVQAEIAEHVADALKIELRAPERPRLEPRRPVRAESYLAYLQGRTLLHSNSTASLEAARLQFERAVSLDPRNAAAYSGLADVTRLTGWRSRGVPRARWDEAGRRFASRALELDPNLSEAHASIGLVLWDALQYAAAEEEFQLALTLNPSYALAHFWYASLLEEEARQEEALREFMLAEGADPFGPEILLHFALLLTWLGRHDEALVKIQKLGELDPAGIRVHQALAAHHLARSELDRYHEESDRVEELEPDPEWKVIHRSTRHALAGEKESAANLLRQLEGRPDFGEIAHAGALVYAELGDLDACFRSLDAARRSGMIPLQRLRLDPRLEPVRKDPRFSQLLKSMNLT